MTAGQRRRYHQEAATQIDADTVCRTMNIDGEPVIVRGAPDWTDADFTFFAEVVRAARLRARGLA